ncbi:Calx-beta domain-containing protein [Vibrio owensii]|uniref:Calx-beta domain-containing protein n=2 Tax=Vibrio harveyi group TaxID=717610 RepID=UPI00390C1860
MDRVAFSSLFTNIVVIGVDGEIKTLEPGQLPAPGELIITEVSDTSELNFEQVTPDGSSINVTDDITALIEAIAAGEDPAQLEGDFETAAGESSGSSPQTTGAVDRTGAESLASTDFETVGTAIALSETQELSLLEFIREQIIPAQAIVQEISSPTISEGQQATFDITLDQPLQQQTDIVLSLGEDTASGGTDYNDTVVTITFEDGSSEAVTVDENGTFTVTIPAGNDSFNISVDTINDDLFEGSETFTLTGGTQGQSEPATGVATIIDDGSGPGSNPDDDRPTVASITDTIVNEGDEATLDVTLSNPSTTDTTVIMNLADGTAEGGIDYTNTSVTITFEDDSTQVIAVNPDGSFEASVPANDTSYSVTINTTDDDIFEGAETFELSGSTLNQNTEQSGAVTILDDGTGPGSDPDDDRPSVSISDAGTINEGDTANFIVSLTNASEDDVQVELGLNLGDTEVGDLGTLEYNTGSGWLAVPNDGVVTVPAGLTEFDVRIASIDDEVYEGPENFTVDVTGLGSVQGADTGTATIVDDGSGPGPDPDDDRPSVSISDAGTINEGDTANFIVSLTNASEDDVQVELGLNLGDTEVGDLGTLEYNTGSGWLAVPDDGVVTVPAGLTEFDVRIASIDDEVYEGPENFTVDVTGLGSVQGADTGTVTIVDDNTGPGPDPDDDRPTVSISDAGTINEGDTANFIVSLTNASEDDVQVELGLNLGDTESGDLGTLEYNTGSGWLAVPNDGVVTVPAGLTQFDVRIASIDDEVFEGSENFTVDVTGLGAVQGADTGTATIVDDGSGPGPDPDDDRPTVSISDAGTINEGDTSNFIVSLTNASEDDVQVELGLNLGDTEAGDLGTLEYNTGSGWLAVPNDGVVTVPAGLTEFDVRIASIDDEVYEGPENFTVDVTGLGAVQGADTGTATIVDDGSGPGPDPDDDRPTVSISDAGTINEGDTANFIVSLTNASEDDVQVELGLNLGDTEAGDLGTLEYNTGSGWLAVPNDGVVTVPAGLTQFDARIASIDDEVYEGPENFTVDVTGLGAVQGADTGTATIVDDGSGPGPDPDDDRPTVTSITSTTVNEGEVATLDVTLSNVSTTPTVVNMTLADGSAEGGVDYTNTLVTITYEDNTTEVINVEPDGSFVVTVPANDSAYSVTMSTTDDELTENTETFTLSGATDVQGVPAIGTTTIIDNDAQLVASISNELINEGEAGTFDVTLSNASDTDSIVSMTLADGTADGGVDYTDTQVTITYADNSTEVVAVNPDGSFDVTVPANDTTYSITVSTTDDDLFEGPETFTLSGATAVQTTPAEGTGTIVDDGSGPGPDPDDDRPTVASISSTTVNEGDPATLDVTMSNASTTDTVVSMTLADGTADGGVDYTDTQVTITYADNSTEIVAVNPDGSFDVTVPANDTTYSITVSTTDDDLFEGPETFTLSGATAVQTSPAEGTGTIVDDGSGPGPDPDDDRPTVASISSTTVNEGDPATLDVTMSNASTTDTVVSMTLADGTADGGVDYTDTQVTITYADNSTEVVAVNPDGSFDVTVPANDTTYSITVSTTDDDLFEGPETFTLSGATAVQTSPAEGTGTIVDDGSGPGPDPDDDRPTVASISSTTVNEGDPATLDVTMSNASTTDTVVSMTLADGTADGGVDYTDTQVTITYADNSTEVVAVNPDGSFDVTVPANDTTYSITVSTTDDDLFEGPETFTLSGATAVQTTPAEGTGTIVDDGSGPGPDPDDDRPTVASISSTTVNEGDPATLDVTMSNASTTDTVVSMTLSDGTADGGVDYTDTQVTITYADNSTEVVAVNPDGSFDVTVPANDTTYSITVSTTDDDLFEGPETFTLSGATAVQTMPAEGTGTIVDDGSGPGPVPDDDRPTVASISSTTVNEGDPATLDVTMSNASTTDTVVSMTLADGTADGGVDYTDTQVTITYADNSTEIVAVNPDGSFDVTVPANDTTYSITVSTTDDDLFEGPETFTLNGATAVQTTPAEGIGTIVDDGSGPGPDPDDDRPTVASISSTTVNEGDPATLDVTMSNASTTDTVVSMTLADGTADGGVDYTNTQVTVTYADNSTEVVAVNPDGSFDVTVPANDTTYSITVSTTDDDLFEGSETFTLSGATAVQTTPAEGTGTIVDDGSGPGPDPDDDRPTVASVSSTTVNEGDPATLDVTMSNASTTDTVVSMTLSDGTADGGVDYTDTQVTITYADNSTEVVAVNPDGSFDVTVPAMDTTFSVTMETLNDDIYEGDETFTLSGSTSVQTTPAVGTVTIDDEADRPSVADITDIQVTEGEDATFNVTLSNASTVAILVSMSLLDGTALAGDDFNATSVTITYADNTTEVVNVAPDGTFDVSVPANDTTFSVTVNTLEDQVYEQSENFTLTGEIQGQNVAASGIGTILDDDNTPPTVEDFNIIIDLNNPGEDALIDFGPYAQDLEDDFDPFDDKETSICITTLPEYGYLYYFDDQNNEVVLEIGDVIPESTEVRYALTEDFFDEQSFDSQDLLDEFDKDFIADTVDVNGLSFFGGTIDSNGDFVNNAQIKVDFANQQVGLVVVSPGETGQGDEISTSEFIAIELDEGLEAEEARLDLASLNDRFNSGAAWINVYFYMDGVLAETQVIQTSDIVFTGNQEGFATVAITNGSFDEIRLFPETNSASDKASFTLVGTQITSFNNVNDSFDYKAIDSDGLTSADTATVDIDFTNVSVDAVEAFGVQVGALQVNTIQGTDQNDNLVGTDSNDILIGGLGDDVLTGGGGNDVFKWTEMDTATDTVTDFESGDSLDFTDLFDDVSESDISVLLDDLSSGDYAGQVDDISVSVTEDGGNSTLTINKDGQQLEVNFDGASAADIANSIITNLEQLRE